MLPKKPWLSLGVVAGDFNPVFERLRQEACSQAAWTRLKPGGGEGGRKEGKGWGKEEGMEERKVMNKMLPDYKL